MKSNAPIIINATPHFIGLRPLSFLRRKCFVPFTKFRGLSSGLNSFGGSMPNSRLARSSMASVFLFVHLYIYKDDGTFEVLVS